MYWLYKPEPQQNIKKYSSQNSGAMKTFLSVLAALCMTSGLMAQNELFNKGFENSTQTPHGEYADDWTIDFFPGGGESTSDAHSGSKAVYIWNWYYYAEGYLTNGNATFPAKGGTPISISPGSLDGYYKYIYGPNGGAADSALVTVLLSHYNTQSQQRDTVGFGSKKLGPVSTYSPFQVSIDYRQNISPDTIVIRFHSSIDGICDPSSNGNCCFLYLDDLSLGSALGTEDISGWFARPKVYPNPAATDPVIDLGTKAHFPVKLHVYNSIGQAVFSQSGIREEKIRIDRNTLGKGQFHFSITDKEGQQSGGNFILK